MTRTPAARGYRITRLAGAPLRVHPRAPIITHQGNGVVCVKRPRASARLNMVWLYVGPSPTRTPLMFGVDPFEGNPTCIDTQITDGRWARVRLGTEDGPVTGFSNAIQFVK